ncbi:hypothetical protein EZS27_010028, partial [termite gut metagenome]
NEKFNAETFRLFLEKLVKEASVGNKENGKQKKILLVLDNAKYMGIKTKHTFLDL